MSRVEQALRRIVADLDESEARWALVGGLAVSARAEPRTTRDVDVAVAVDSDAEAEALVNDLLRRGYTVLETVEQTAADRLATARLRPPGPSSALVDVLFASSGIEPDVVAAAERLAVLPGFEVPVAQTGHLIAMKVLARDDRRRPQDWDDIRALLAVANRRETERATRAVRTIQERGFARDRDLPALLRRAIDELG